MKLILRCCAATLSLFFFVSLAAQAAPSLQLDRMNVPTEVRPDQPVPLSATYKEAQGDKPTSVVLVVQTPGGEIGRFPPQDTSGRPDAPGGMQFSWQYNPAAAGTYHYHFEAASPFGAVREPASAADDYQFVLVNMVTKYTIFVAGLLVAFLILPFVIYMAARSLNRRGDPAAAARVGLLLGVLASLGLFIYLFAADYGVLGISIAAVAALAVLIVLFSRRRAV